jgi:hypothetical protein
VVVSATAPASSGQEQLWLAEQAAPDRPANNDVRAWRLHGPLDCDALRAAIDMVVARHAALRTVLRTADSGLYQQVTAAPVAPVALAGDDAPTPALHAAVDEFVHKPFDLAAGPPMRVGLARLDRHQHLLVLVIHHTACDGVSFEVLREDLVAAYEAHVAGAAATATDPDEGYLAFAADERSRWAADESAARPWLARLRGAGAEHQQLSAVPRPHLVAPAATCE